MIGRLSVLIAALALAGCDSNGGGNCTSDCVTVNDGGQMTYGSGKLKTETRPVGAFTAIRFASPAIATIERTGQDSLAVTADDNLLAMFETQVKGGALLVSLAKGKSFAGKIPTFRITVADLRELDIAGSGHVEASKLDGGALSVTSSGSGDMRLAGRSDELSVKLAGSGSVDAGQLQAKSAKVTVSGSGSVTVNASEALDATVSGSGSVDYIGSPKLASHVSGSGSIKRK